MSNILIIEDDKSISNALKIALEREGHSVDQAFDGEDGVFVAQSENFDLIILDIMMPFMNGFEVIAHLRNSGDEIPIIVLSARVESDDKIRGLNLGADDYVEKPFDLGELIARVNRKLKNSLQRKIEFFGFVYKFNTKELFFENSKVKLNTKEQKILEYLLNHKGHIVTRDAIINSVWGHDYNGTDRTVDNYIVSLRKKLNGQFLETVRGEGYRFVINL